MTSADFGGRGLFWVPSSRSLLRLESPHDLFLEFGAIVLSFRGLGAGHLLGCGRMDCRIAVRWFGTWTLGSDC